VGLSIRALRQAQVALLAGALVLAALNWQAEDWRPFVLFLVLLTFALSSEAFRLKFKDFTISGSFLGLVLAMTLLGPAPAVAIGLAITAVGAVRQRMSWDRLLPNLSTYAVFPLVGALTFEALGGQALIEREQVVIVPVMVGIFLGTNLLNFLLIAVDVWVVDGPSVMSSLKRVYVPVFPLEVAIGLLTTGAAYTYAHLGLWAVGTVILLGLVFQYLVATALAAMERGEQLQERTDEVEQRNQELAALQVGLISTMLKTLSLRDRMTARHSAAVARYSREVASEMGLSEREQELIHTAALFHDIGKFIFPDSILLADKRLTDEEYAIVKRHPEVGAELIGEIDGYGPVAEIVRWHHERPDGRGYPDGLTGSAIPMGSRIIAVADVYDVITARDTYRKPVPVPEALAELRRCAGTQFDPEVVEAFIRVIETRGVRFQHSTHTDFEAELALRTRVADYAAPRQAA